MSRRWSQTRCVTVLALLATFVVTTSFAFGSQLVVLEDQTADPAVLDTMHNDMITSGFVLLRPLQGRLAGQGNLWAVPATLSVQDATTLVSEMDGCLQAIDAATGTNGTEVLESGAIVYSGKLCIGFDADLETKQDAVEQLGTLGFVLFWQFHYWTWISQWSFLPLEYSVQEAITEVEAVGGVLDGMPVGYIKGWVCEDPNGDGRVNILDLIFVRNRLNQDPFSGDNWKADVNQDGRINILDLIYVRNRLGASHTAELASVAFSPDGTKVLTGSYDNTAKLWYAEPFTLSVRSSPFSGLHLCPDHTEVTPYERVYYAPATVTFSAPPGPPMSFVICIFAYWKINGVPQPPRQTDIEVCIEADTTVEAVYDLFPDADGNCRVNILDMIFVRNRLNQDVNTGSNWKADVNLDGRINILDLIHVRNWLNWTCR